MKTLCFADQKLTVLTEQFIEARSARKRREILKKALPLCTDVSDVRMFYTRTSPSDPLRRIISKRWDEIMLSQLNGVSRWTISRTHRLYNLCRSGSVPEAYVWMMWGALLKQSFGRD